MIKKIASYIKLGFKIVKKYTVFSTLKRWGACPLKVLKPRPTAGKVQPNSSVTMTSTI